MHCCDPTSVEINVLTASAKCRLGVMAGHGVKFTVPGSLRSIFFSAFLRGTDFPHTCVVRCTVLSVQGHRRNLIFVMRRRRACIGDHGTGGGGTLSPPLGTATHRYIFPYILFGMCTDIHCNRVIKW
jgi:hypothetical protein